jgi:chemosensory pili system protein ChpA (sensor histidine kinase/response regulator)
MLLAESEESEGSPRALVVDDDDPIRIMLSKLIERQNFRVDTARDGEEAIERLKDGTSYDLILLDLMMPRVDGYAVLRFMAEHLPASLTRTIIASAVPESEIARQVKTPVFRIHSKPFDMQKLLADMKECGLHRAS